jgi:hypothetical protein
MPISLHEDTFYDYFRPMRLLEAEHNIWGGCGLETFGKDFEAVRRRDPGSVWTVVDGDSRGEQWIIPGVHYVNRVCYLISEIPHHWVDVEFRVNSRTSLTTIGLTRQRSQLANYINAHPIRA